MTESYVIADGPYVRFSLESHDDLEMVVTGGKPDAEGNEARHAFAQKISWSFCNEQRLRTAIEKHRATQMDRASQASQFWDHELWNILREDPLENAS